MPLQVVHRRVGLHVLMRVLSVTSSRFFGGPERQMLGLAIAARQYYETVFASFSEEGKSSDFIRRVSDQGFRGLQLRFDTPRFYGAIKELKNLIRETGASVLVCQGYKANLLGWLAARQAAVPVVSVSRGWTSECRRVRLYEWADKRVLARMDKVVCVSAAQASRVVHAGVSPANIEVVRNSVCVDRFQNPQAEYRQTLLKLFPMAVRHSLRYIIGAAGRLSPEKGYSLLIDACKLLAATNTQADFGVVLFGDGILYRALQEQIESFGLSRQFILAGFTADLDKFMPHFDMFVQSSYTEGLPNVLLEAAAACVPVVATDVGGTREVVVHGMSGLIVPAADPKALADSMKALLADSVLRESMRLYARAHVRANFSYDAQATRYRDIVRKLVMPPSIEINNLASSTGL